LKVTGTGHQGLSPSGISRSAFGSRLRRPWLVAEMPTPESLAPAA